MINTNLEQTDGALHALLGKKVAVTLLIGNLIMVVVQGELTIEEYNDIYLYSVSSENIRLGFLNRNVEMVGTAADEQKSPSIILHSLASTLVDEVTSDQPPVV